MTRIFLLLLLIMILMMLMLMLTMTILTIILLTVMSIPIVVVVKTHPPRNVMIGFQGGRIHYYVNWDRHSTTVVRPALCTPEICVVLLDGSRICIPIDSDKPLPMELYDDSKSLFNDTTSTKEEFDRSSKSLVENQIDVISKKLTPDLEREIAGLALAYFRNTQNGNYEFVRCVKSTAAFSKRFGIHMIFIAHPRDDASAGKLFSVHVATGDPPVVLDCRILSDIDTQSMYKGKPFVAGVRVSLRRNQIACHYCAEEYYKN